MRNWFNQASQLKDYKREVDFLTRQLEFAESRALRAEGERDLALKAIVTERTKHDKFVAVAMDKLTKNTGAFQKVVQEPLPLKPPEPDPIEDAKILAAAEENRDADIEGGFEPWPLEEYARRIKGDLKTYLPS